MKELKKYYLLILIVVVIFPLAVLITKPKLEEISQGAQTIKTNKDKLAILTNKAELLAGLNEADLTDKLQRLNFVLPSEKSADSLIFTLDRLTNEASVSTQSISFSPGSLTNSTSKPVAVVNTANKTVNKEEIDVSLEVEGKLDNLRSLFGKLRDSHLAIKITKLTFDKGVNDLTTASVTIQVFYKTIPMKLGEISQPLTSLTDKEQKFITELNTLIIPETINPSVEINNTSRTNPFSGQ